MYEGSHHHPHQLPPLLDEHAETMPRGNPVIQSSCIPIDSFPIATCYCVAETFKMSSVTRYLRDQHGVLPKQYDECLYFYYEPIMKQRLFPTHPFFDMNRPNSPVLQDYYIQQSPPVARKYSGRIESINHLKQQPEEEVVRQVAHSAPETFSDRVSLKRETPSKSTFNSPLLANAVIDSDSQPRQPTPTQPNQPQQSPRFSRTGSPLGTHKHLNKNNVGSTDSIMRNSDNLQWMTRSEVFLFDYGVVVLWNFSEEEELVFLRMIKRFAMGRLVSDDFEIENFRFEYDLAGPQQPRIYNDIITLKSHSQLIKLTISHGLAQSVKLALFENVMEETIKGAIPLSRMMAKYGQVKMNRMEVMKIVGRLFKLKMNVNLVSNVMDTPEIFWVEPQLESLYNAVRVYLEISQRAKLLNSRADVLSDLLDMLSEHLNSNENTHLTWIVIILIIGAIIVATGEVVVKFIRMGAGLSD